MSPCLGGVDGTKCADGHEGPRCASCSLPDRYYDSASATCEECGNVEHYALKQLAVLLVIIVVLALLRLACFRKPRLLARISSRLAQFLASMQHLGLQAKWVAAFRTLTHPTSHHTEDTFELVRHCMHRFKLLLSFGQVWLVRESVYGLYATQGLEPRARRVCFSAILTRLSPVALAVLTAPCRVDSATGCRCSRR